MSVPGIDSLLDDLYEDVNLQREWELNPSAVAKRYCLSDRQLECLLKGDVEALISEGIAERHVQQMRVSW